MGDSATVDRPASGCFDQPAASGCFDEEVTVEEVRRQGLCFDVTDTGPLGGRTVIALHGFPEDRHSWASVAADLATNGYRVLAPDQRGYSPGARPPDRHAYRISELVGDVLSVADAAGADRFDLVGHDWGAAVAWVLAARHPERIRSLTALSVPHPRAFLAAMGRSTQLLHSWYMLAFQLPTVPEAMLGLGGGAPWLAILRASGLDEATAARSAQRARQPGAMTGPINWYRAAPLALRHPLAPVRVATLFIWGDRDRFVTRAAAEGCAAWVDAPYRFEALPGRSHWLPTTAPDTIGELLLEHLAAS